MIAKSIVGAAVVAVFLASLCSAQTTAELLQKGICTQDAVGDLDGAICTTRIASARPITVSVGQEASNTDFALIPGRAASVSGTALDSHGHPFKQVGSNKDVRGEDFGSLGTVGSQHRGVQ